VKCQQCSHLETKVLESRESKDGRSVRRRRECQNCGFRFTTFERSEERPVFVIKKNSSKELFDRQKLLKSILVATQKRNIDPKELQSIAQWVENRAGMSDDREISTTQIGELVLDVLRHLDPVAYVRFASVYRSFEGPDDFVHELERLSQNPPKIPGPTELDSSKELETLV
jgi:transcriptional repressor NrdR